MKLSLKFCPLLPSKFSLKFLIFCKNLLIYWTVCWVTAFMNDDSQAILAGDPRQLGPVIMSSSAKIFGLGESLLSRFLMRFPYQRDPESYPETDGYDPRLVTKLLYNYRSLPDILHMYSTLFYDSSLISQVNYGIFLIKIPFFFFADGPDLTFWQSLVFCCLFCEVSPISLVGFLKFLIKKKLKILLPLVPFWHRSFRDELHSFDLLNKAWIML